MKHSIVYLNGEPSVVTAFHGGEIYTAIAEHHPNFGAIVAALLDKPEDESVIDLFDITKTVSRKFERLTERVTLRNGVVYFDGDAVNNTLTNQIVRFVNEGVQNWKPLVAFMEKVMQNPNPNSRDQLFLWLDNGDFTITADGDFVGYKGVRIKDGVPSSTVQAPAKDGVTVNGEPVTGYVPNPDGAVVEMPRSVVDDDEDRYCSVGLHVGTYNYAKGFTGHVLEVHVNPRDVVSVTSDSNREKIRTCRYTVVKHIPAPYQSAISYEDYDDDFYDDDDDLYDNEYTEDELESERDELVEEIGEISEAIEKIDTRLNHIRQQRYPKGHPKAGQFVPRNT